VAVLLAGVLLLATGSQQAALGGPLPAYLRGYPPDPRAAAARQVLLALPPDAPVAVTSQLGPHVPMRRQLYYFPGNRAYDAAGVERARWVVADRRRTTNERAAIERLQASGQWRTVLDVQDYVLLERAA
jgi:hypothetical protein